jgi:hypothetical protein
VAFLRETEVNHEKPLRRCPCQGSNRTHPEYESTAKVRKKSFPVDYQRAFYTSNPHNKIIMMMCGIMATQGADKALHELVAGN